MPTTVPPSPLCLSADETCFVTCPLPAYLLKAGCTTRFACPSCTAHAPVPGPCAVCGDADVVPLCPQAFSRRVAARPPVRPVREWARPHVPAAQATLPLF